MKVRRASHTFALFWALALGNACAQPGDPWRQFTKADGLADDACLFVTVSGGGDVLVRHPNTGVVSVFDGYKFTQIPGPDQNRSRVYGSPGGQLWTVASEGLQEFREGNWMLHRIPEIAEAVRLEKSKHPAALTAEPVSEVFLAHLTKRILLLPVRQGQVLIMLPDRLLRFEAGEPELGRVELLLRADQTALGKFTAMTPTRDGGLWIAGTNGFVRIAGPVRNLKPGFNWKFVDQEPEALKGRLGGELAKAGSLPGEVLDATSGLSGISWIATPRGLYCRTPTIWQPAERIETVPGVNGGTNTSAETFARLVSLLPEELGRLAEWKVSLVTKNGDAWLASTREIAWRHEEAWRVFSSTNQLAPADVLAFAEALDGRVWCATPDRVWEFDGQNWLVLRSGFGWINALLCARNGTVWVAGTNGVQRYVRGAWIDNGPEEGLPAAVVLRLREDEAGRLVAETAAGPSAFRPEADNDPPRTEIITASPEEATFREGAMVRVVFSGRDKWNVTTPERLLFSHRLDEREWSPFQEAREVMFNDLPVGKHYFQVRAMDRNANLDPKPARLEFAVIGPWYRETRLVVVLTFALGVAVFFAALAVNRHRKLRLSYAEVERQVAERTRQLEVANRELVHSQKMNALGTLAAGIAHDFNNLLSIIKGSAQIIEDHLDDPPKVRTRLDRIKTMVQQGSGIVEAMLGFSRNSEELTAPCDVNGIVADTVRLLGDRFLREAEVKFEPANGLPAISVARDFLQQVLLNFIFNAAESMSGRKQIVLRTREVVTLPEPLALPPAKAARYLAVSVQDAGSGISPEVLPRIFEPFFTTKGLSARRGTGLGLSMVYELAKKMGAGLAVETAVGVGSTFSILLPVQAAREPAPAHGQPGRIET